MRRLALWLVVLASPGAALARPGFYVGFAGGGSFVSGEGVEYGRFQEDEIGDRITSGPPITTAIKGGPAARFTLGFNVLGYGALEAAVSGHGTDLFDRDVRSGAGHAHLGLRGYPLWHWQSKLPSVLQPLEPSVFLGWGYSIQGYTPPLAADPVGFSKVGTWRMGVGVEYFVIDYFKVSLEYQAITASYNNFIFNFDESMNYPVEPSASTTFHQILVGVGFQYSPVQEQVRYANEPGAPAAAPAPHEAAPPAAAPAAPASDPVIDG